MRSNNGPCGWYAALKETPPWVVVGLVVVVAERLHATTELATSAAYHISSTLPPAPQRARKVTFSHAGAVHIWLWLLTMEFSSTVESEPKAPLLAVSLWASDLLDDTVT
mmetsp:Transcript_12236/g.26528  ORF Transcript_12236/g.26528 Transcript_12236/m.26528 type:complete len:109 (+) Transcript_12236:97-423(+)